MPKPNAQDRASTHGRQELPQPDHESGSATSGAQEKQGFARLHLRVAIGVMNALFVLLVGTVALLVTATVSLDTLRSNGERHVRALGGAATQKVESFFFSIESVSEGVRDWMRLEPYGLPSEDPTRMWNESMRAAAQIPDGGMRLEQLRKAWWAVMAEAKFKPLTLNVWLIDGTRLMSLPLLNNTPHMFMETLYQSELTSPIPNGDPKLSRFIRGINAKTATALELGDVPSVDSFLQHRIDNFPVVDLRLKPVQAVLDPLTNKTFGAAAKWSPVRYFYDHADFFYSFAMTSLYNSSKDFLGYCLCAVEVINIGKEFDAVRPTASTMMFLIDNGGFIMGATEGIDVYNKTELLNLTAPVPPGCTTTEESKGAVPSTQNVTMCRHHARDSDNAVLQSLAAEGKLFTDGLQTIMGVGGTNFYVRVDALKSVTLEATVVVVVPESDIIGDVQRTVLIAAVSTAAVVVVAAVMSFFFVWSVLHPLVTIAVQMGRAARLEEDDDEVTESMMAEIGDLQRAFIEMRDELSRIRAFVPQSLLKAGLMDSDDEIILEDISNGGDSTDRLTSGLGTSHDSRLTVMSAAPSVVASVGHHSRAGPLASGAAARARTAADPLEVSDSNNNSTPSGFGSRRPAARMAVRGALGLRRENVTFLVINLRRYHEKANTGLEATSVAALVDTILRAVESEKGVLDSFHGDRFFVSFNAVRSAANHDIRAAVSIARVVQQIAALGQMALPVTAGISSGPAQVGNLGSKSVTRFSIVGPVVSQAVTLERLCKMYEWTSCLIPQRMMEDVCTAVEVAAVDFVQLPFMKNPCLIARISKEFERDTEEDMEWMYQLQDTDGGAGLSRSTSRRANPLVVLGVRDANNWLMSPRTSQPSSPVQHPPIGASPAPASASTPMAPIAASSSAASPNGFSINNNSTSVNTANTVSVNGVSVNMPVRNDLTSAPTVVDQEVILTQEQINAFVQLCGEGWEALAKGLTTRVATVLRDVQSVLGIVASVPAFAARFLTAADGFMLRRATDQHQLKAPLEARDFGSFYNTAITGRENGV